MSSMEESRSMSVHIPVAKTEQALLAGTELLIMTTLGRRQAGAAAQDAEGVQATADDIDLCVVGSDHRIHNTSNFLLSIQRGMARPSRALAAFRRDDHVEQFGPTGRSSGSSR